MSELTISGKIKEVFEEKSGVSASGKAWRMRDYLIEEDGEQYPDSIKFTLSGEKIDTYDLKVGDKCKVTMNCRCRQGSKGGWFNSITAWKIDKEATQNTTSDISGNEKVEMLKDAFDAVEVESNTLPF